MATSTYQQKSVNGVRPHRRSHRRSIVAGAGIWGCTVARRLAEAGRKVLVLEKRVAVGGNCRCEIDAETGIEIHTYGSHIFHTSIPEVWEFVNRFTSFNDYKHVVIAKHDGKLYHLPIGKTLYREFGTDDKQAIFDAFIKNYTAKQWGVPADQVDPAVIKRLKVRDTDSVRYFDDTWEGIPSEGYNKMFERMLDHPNIEVRCNAEFQISGFGFQVNGEELPAVPVYYSGPIDALFGYRFGPLPWRTLRFELERVDRPDVQGTTVVNYVDADVPFTRQHEYKHFHPEWPESKKTIICREYSSSWQPGDEPYYPIANADSAALLAKYQAEAAKVSNLVIGGRLGQYKYFDMDKAMAAALELSIG